MNDSLSSQYAVHHAYVLDRLEASKGRWAVVAEESGVSIRTLEKIARREIKTPRLGLIDDLTAYFRGREQEAGQRIAS